MAEYSDADAARLHETVTKVAVMEQQMSGLNEKIEDLKAGQATNGSKIDEVLALARDGDDDSRRLFFL